MTSHYINKNNEFNKNEKDENFHIDELDNIYLHVKFN